jgi:light-regulated signal transduction histidine kinase (bacteriophytochrome)
MNHIHLQKLIKPSIIVNALILSASRPIQASTTPRENVPVSPLLISIGAVFVFGFVFFLLYRAAVKKSTAEYSAEIQRLEKINQDQLIQLKATTDELEAFAYSVSHDLRSPLRSMMAYTEILLADHNESMNQEGRLYQERVRANLERLDQFIADILTFSGLSSQVLALEMVQMEKLTQTVISELRSQIGEREVKFNLQSLPAVMADPALIRIVLMNLIDNAIKFTQNQQISEILIGFKEESGQGIYFIEDNGIGLDAKYSETIFNPFQRLHGVDQYKGSGIGLALVKRIISRHGGRVWVEAAEEKGAVFYFTIGEFKKYE